MIDYPAALAVATVVRTGSFEKAARVLNVTPSAVSQRVRQIEERLGAALIERGSPCLPTEKGARLCRHMELVGALENNLLDQLPELSDSGPRPVTVDIAVNADSLGTWFLKAAAEVARDSSILFNIAIDDQDHTAEWLRRGRVLAAVTSLAEPVTGCRGDGAGPAALPRHGQSGLHAALPAQWGQCGGHGQGPGADLQPEGPHAAGLAQIRAGH